MYDPPGCLENPAHHADEFSEIKCRSDLGEHCSLLWFLKTKAGMGDQGKIQLT